jgi:hypothetical protein
LHLGYRGLRGTAKEQAEDNSPHARFSSVHREELKSPAQSDTRRFIDKDVLQYMTTFPYEWMISGLKTPPGRVDASVADHLCPVARVACICAKLADDTILVFPDNLSVRNRMRLISGIAVPAPDFVFFGGDAIILAYPVQLG